MVRRHLGFALNIAALGLFFPGILAPMFNLSMEMEAKLGGARLTTPLIDKELSIIVTVQDLWADERLLAAALIFLFSVCVPLLKTSLITMAYCWRDSHKESVIARFVTTIGKWSMADVFVVAVFLVILSTNHAETATVEELRIFGFQLGLQISTETLSAVGRGFYYFTAYCLVSLAGTQLYLSGVTASASRVPHNQSR